jgi:hypothetical protein
MIIWGGTSDTTGGRYNPTTNTWIATSTVNAPAGRAGPKAVWTGTEMIVWGGGGGMSLFSTGGRYNPSTDSWTATSLSNAPSHRTRHTAVWSGSEMIVWGGCITTEVCVGFTNTGGRYCAQAGATPTPTPTPTVTPCTGRCTPTPRPRPTPAPRPSP